MNKILLIAAAPVLALAFVASPAPAADLAIPATGFAQMETAATSASADVAAFDKKHKRKKWKHGRGNARYDRYDRYDSNGRYAEPRRITRNSRMWRGNDGRYYCKRDNGTTGLVIGAGVGAIAGHEIAGRGDRTIGAILGGVVGGLIGREIDRGSLQCR